MSDELLQKLENGRLAKSGLLSADQIQSALGLIAQAKGKNIETVRVVFADQHGILRGKAIVVDALPSVFCSGLCVPSTLLLKDTSNRTVFPVWREDAGVCDNPMNGAGDILLVPDPDTFRQLPWSEHSAWLFCNAAAKSGEALPFDPRSLLIRASEKLAASGYALTVGLEVEFHVYELQQDGVEHSQSGMPGEAPETRLLSQGYQLLSDGRYGELENIMDMLRVNAQELGLPVRSMEIEMGPGQFEFTFNPATPLEHADNMMKFRAMVKEVCANQGLHATFMCRPKCENSAANGWHLHQSLTDLESGENLFMPKVDGQLTKHASGWIAGLLKYARETCLLTTPSVNGYKRYQPFQLAPDRIQWGRDNRGTMIRALDSAGDAASRIENRVAETTANPYYFFASQILAGLSGIEQGLTASEPVETPYENDAEKLPTNLGEAIEAFEQSSFYRDQLGDAFVDYLTCIKRAEWQRYLSHISEWEQDEYFSLY